MVKVRLLLSVLMTGLLVGGGWVEANVADFGDRVLLYGLEGVLFLSASLLMALTFFVLDKEGRIPQNSYAWKYFSGFYIRTEKTEEGKEIEVVKMPASLKLCPAFWMIFVGVAGLAVFVGLAFVLMYLVGAVAYSVAAGGVHWNPQPVGDWRGFGLALMFVVVVLGTLATVCVTIIGALNKNKTLNAICYAVVVVSAGVLVFIYVTSVDKEALSESLSYALRYAFFKGLLLSAGFIVIMSAIALLILGGMSGFKWIKNTIVWQLVVAMYHQVCPQIPIEVLAEQPKNPEAQN